MYIARITSTNVCAHGNRIKFKDYVGCCGATYKRYGMIARDQLRHKQDVSITVALCDCTKKTIIPYGMVDYATVSEKMVPIKEEDDG